MLHFYVTGNIVIVIKLSGIVTCTAIKADHTEIHPRGSKSILEESLTFPWRHLAQ